MATSLKEFSTTAASNTAVGTANVDENCPPSGINNAIRQALAYIVDWFMNTGTISSAATTDLGTKTQNYLAVSGTTTITAFGTPTNKTEYTVKFDGALTLTHNATSLILPGGVNVLTIAGEVAKFRHEGSGNWRCVSYPARWAHADGTAGQVLTSNGSGALPTMQSIGMPMGYLTGLTLSNNGSDANNDIDIAIGKARDATDTVDINLGSAITKQLDASWAVGTNQGGLDTGVKAISTWYHLWLIKRSDTGVVDVLFSASATSPTMPASYDYKRRLGSVLTDGSGNIRGFVQNHDLFQWKAAIVDVNVSNLGTTATGYTMSTPPGFKCVGMFHYDLTAQSSRTVYFQSPNITDASASTSAAPYGQAPKDTATAGSNGFVMVETNTSSQIKLSASAASTTIVVLTDGWFDTRGK